MQGRDLRRYFGLCDNLLRNCNNGQEREDLLNELQAQFKDARLDTDYPFNQNREEFLHDSNRNFNYLNPARLAWVQRFSDPVLQNPLDWLDNPSEEYLFKHGVGLCTNLSLYCEMLKLDYSQEWRQAKRQLESQFDLAGLDIRTPFNNTANHYRLERNKYTNPKRLDWIKRHANPVL